MWAFTLDDGEMPGLGYQYLDHVQPHTFSSGVNYSNGGFWNSWTAQYGSGLRTGPNNSLSVPAHWVGDTTVGYQFSGKSALAPFKVSLDVLNILDNRYPITLANGFTGSRYAAGRQFWFHVSREF